MLKDLAPKYFLEQDHNCSESTLLAISEGFGLGLDKKDVTLISGFGAGMGCEQLCGVLAGCVAACGCMAVTDRAHATEGFGDLCAELVHQFDARLGGTQCSVLKPMYRNDTVRCLKTVELGLELFQEFAQEQGLTKK